jgi:hypothetical protein
MMHVHIGTPRQNMAAGPPLPTIPPPPWTERERWNPPRAPIPDYDGRVDHELEQPLPPLEALSAMDASTERTIYHVCKLEVLSQTMLVQMSWEGNDRQGYVRILTLEDFGEGKMYRRQTPWGGRWFRKKKRDPDQNWHEVLCLQLPWQHVPTSCHVHREGLATWVLDFGWDCTERVWHTEHPYAVLHRILPSDTFVYFRRVTHVIQPAPPVDYPSDLV